MHQEISSGVQEGVSAGLRQQEVQPTGVQIAWSKKGWQEMIQHEQNRKLHTREMRPTSGSV